MSSSGVGPSNSCNGSPRPAGGVPTTTRRRVADLMIDAERSSNSSDFFDHEGGDGDDSIGGTHFQNLHHHQYYYHHPVIRYLLLRSRAFFCVPDAWLLKIENGFIWAAVMAQSLRSGRNIGRKIFGFLMLLAVISVFLKVSFPSAIVEVSEKKVDNGLLIIHTFKDDRAMVQRAVTETQTAMPKRVLERLRKYG